jgi:hypothetical protein
MTKEVAIKRDSQDKTEAALMELNAGKITFGEFNKKRRILVKIWRLNSCN